MDDNECGSDDRDDLTEQEEEHAVTEESSEPEKGTKERIYDKIPVSLPMLDIIIKLLFVAVAVAVILGIIAGRQ